jgi:D-2-hydroxyacid dehydrogenase (NADP+)
MNLLILLTLPEPVRNTYRERLAAAFPGAKVDLVDHHSKVDPYIAEADVLVSFGPMLADHVFGKARKLKWVQALGTGVDGIVDQPSLGRDVIVTNMHGFHGVPMSEAALMAMLALARDLPRSLRSQGAKKWDRFPARTLAGKTVAIFGVGAIAARLAPLCKALGMSVLGISSAPRELEGFDRVFPRDELAHAAGEADYLVLLTPYTPATRGIVGREVLAAMKPGACLVNLARGGVVDEAALIEALRAGRLAGAALDVFSVEPLPAESRLWEMPNVIVTPHLGGFFEDYPRFALPVVEENLRRFLAGDTAGMLNLVKR